MQQSNVDLITKYINNFCNIKHTFVCTQSSSTQGLGLSFMYQAVVSRVLATYSLEVQSLPNPSVQGMESVYLPLRLVPHIHVRVRGLRRIACFLCRTSSSLVAEIDSICLAFGVNSTLWAVFVSFLMPQVLSYKRVPILSSSLPFQSAYT